MARPIRARFFYWVNGALGGEGGEKQLLRTFLDIPGHLVRLEVMIGPLELPKLGAWGLYFGCYLGIFTAFSGEIPPAWVWRNVNFRRESPVYYL